jgi:mgtE-like transporter
LVELTAIPVLLILIPPFVSQAGALGGIFSSRISSKLQIGVITPRGLPEPPALVDGTIVFALGVVVFSLIGIIAVGLATLTGHAPVSPGRVVAGALLAGLIATPVTIVFSYYLAIVTYRFGLDPDNQTVPIITSVMDLVGVACVLFVMSVSGVLPHG